MKNLQLNNGLTVSQICLGAMNFGTTTDEKTAFTLLDAFVEHGGNFIDTSNNYAHWAGTGDESETVLGKWLKNRQDRQNLVIATKVGFDRKGEGAGLKKAQIEYWVEQSLKKLQTDYIDLYYAHTDDINTPQQETMAAFDSLIKSGKVRALGASNYDVWRLQDANACAKEQNGELFTVNQQRFSYLFERGDCAPKYKFNEYTTRERLRFLREKQMPLVAYSCLAGGGYENDARLPAAYIGGNRLNALRDMAKQKGVTASALVVAWLCNLYRFPDFPVVIPLFASSNLSHFIDNLSGADLTLTDEEMIALIQA